MLFQTLNLPSQALSTFELALKALSDLIVALSCPLTPLISKKPLLLQDFVSFGAPPSLFGQRPRRGRSPVEHRGTFVRPFVRSFVRSSPQAFSGLKSALSGLKSASSGLKSALSGLKSALSDLKFTLSGLKSALSGLKSERAYLQAGQTEESSIEF